MLNVIKNISVLKLIFGNLKKKRKLQLIKYNKTFLHKLKIKIKDFHDYLLLKEINQKFDINIKDVDIEVLDLENRVIGNEILYNLNKIGFTELKELNLVGNELSDINELQNSKFEKLECLELSDNNIADINILKNVNFQKLKELFKFKL